MTHVANNGRPKGDPELMRENARKLLAIASDLRDEKNRTQQRVLDGEGGLIERMNRREFERTQALEADAVSLDQAAARLVEVASGVETAQSQHDRDARNNKQRPGR